MVKKFPIASSSEIKDAVEDLYRDQSRFVFATLIRLIGDFDLAEEALQEAFAVAVVTWQRDGMPAKIIYKRSRKNPDSGDVEETTEEDRLFKFIEVSGVTQPWIIDHFVNGVQTTRINYENVVYNQPLPDSIFAKPTDVKQIK